MMTGLDLSRLVGNIHGRVSDFSVAEGIFGSASAKAAGAGTLNIGQDAGDVLSFSCGSCLHLARAAFSVRMTALRRWTSGR